MTGACASPMDAQRRFGGLQRLYGVAGAQAIRQAHVAVVGIGGVGSWTAEALARSGVGEISLIDLDHVSESNINRQIHALDDTLGQAKVVAMQARMRQINPQCRVHAIDAFVEAENWPGILPHGVQLVVDACDQLQAKVAMAAWALQQRTAFVCVGAAGGKQRAEQVEVADAAQVTHDPMLARLRYVLRRQHGAAAAGKRMGLPCVFSREPVRMPAAMAVDKTLERSLNCHGYGSSVAVTASFGLCAAGWALNRLAQGF